MGFSTSAAFAILGVCIFVCLDILSSSFLPSLSELNTSYKYMEKRMVERLNTDIDVINISKTSGTTYNISIKVKNTGNAELDVSDFTVIVNGTIESYSADKEYLYPLDIVNITVTNLTYTGTIRVKVVTGNGIGDYGTYTA
ncbi:MAG: hypothetical protein FE037_02410 [Thermoplasmata archaeon]|nr:MAG: hypothetical protein FE042_00415 [Thermoplasmata archaeon]KAA0015233.1 MAG: hypothetical protein FE037_02410 [Thermoplasmata archaeon]